MLAKMLKIEIRSKEGYTGVYAMRKGKEND